MNPRFLLAILLLAAPLAPAGAVEVLVNGTASYQTSDPTSSAVADWNTGWGESGIDGWDYVGTVNGASGVYLGNGWVLTAGHVGAGTFTLDGTSYDLMAGTGTVEGFSSGAATADLTAFKLATSPDLPPLAIATTLPLPLSNNQSGSKIVMIGYGGGAESWGFDTVTGTGDPISVDDATYLSKDFETAYGKTTDGTHSATDDAVLIPGDSGGGDFVYNSATGKWMLAGINEAVETDDSYMVQLDDYASQIDATSGVPEPAGVLPAGAGLALLAGLGFERRFTRPG